MHACLWRRALDLFYFIFFSRPFLQRVCSSARIELGLVTPATFVERVVADAGQVLRSRNLIYLRSRITRPLFVSALFFHCVARSICQSPSTLNILHLSRQSCTPSDFSQPSQLLSWLAKLLDLNSHFPITFSSKLQKLPCASNHLGDDPQVRPRPPS
jgi:hypothetical protein